jgi:hypothetical protein
VKVLLAGEGKTELGTWGAAEPYRSPAVKGLLESLLDCCAPDSCSVADGVPWRLIRKFSIGGHRSAEQRNVLGLALRALETGCDAIAFVRDRDRREEREAEIEAAIRESERLFPNVAVAGGVAVEAVESFVLTMMGDARAEAHGDPKAVLEGRGCISLEQKVAIIRDANLATLAPSAASLQRWLERARKALGSTQPG